MFNLFAKEIDPAKILRLQNFQYTEKLLLSDEVPASSQKLGSVNISSLGHFYCQFITGGFSTLYDNAGNINDDGLSHLRVKITDGSNQRPLFNDYIPLDLFLSPGRQKNSESVNFATDTKSETLFYPQPFQYMFTVNSEILVDAKNDSDTPNFYDLVFHGVRFPLARRNLLKK